MSRVPPSRWLVPALAIGLVLIAVWQWRSKPGSPGNEMAPLANAVQQPATAPAPVASAPTIPGGYVGPDPASLTPAERQAMLDREVEASAAAPPPPGYRGIDGKPRAFRYPDAAVAAGDEAAREARREALMRELAADPAAFGRKYRLSAKQMQWIVDGETDFPDALLEP